MAVALTALVVAIAGTAMAAPIAVNSILNKQEKRKVTNIATNKANQVIDQRAPGLSVANAQNAQNATNAQSATSAALAQNSSLLGGLSQSAFTRRDCSSVTGQLRGFADVNPNLDGGLGTNFELVGGYNCSGGTVEARRVNLGDFEVRFNGIPAAVERLSAVATYIDPPDTGLAADVNVALEEVSNGHWEVSVTNISGVEVDGPFALVAF